jgi:uncharacterized protein (DUF305 family)
MEIFRKSLATFLGGVMGNLGAIGAVLLPIACRPADRLHYMSEKQSSWLSRWTSPARLLFLVALAMHGIPATASPKDSSGIPRNHRAAKRTFALLIIPVAAVALAACGGGGSFGSMSGRSVRTSPVPASSVVSEHNDQDVRFAQMMIRHHRQAIEMAMLGKSRASMPEVKQLATAIEAAQALEIKQMTAWLRSWGASVPSGDMGMGHDMGEGMMSEQDMKKLGTLSGTQFDKTFLTMMIKHHQGAVMMAKTEQTSGQSSAAKTLAGHIVTSQNAEITKMQGLLKKM